MSLRKLPCKDKGLDRAWKTRGQKGETLMNKILCSFFNSCRGLQAGAKTERAVRQELIVLALAIPAALTLSPSLWVRVALIGVSLVVLAV
jgi:diacylglycerol kinase